MGEACVESVKYEEKGIKREMAKTEGIKKANV